MSNIVIVSKNWLTAFPPVAGVRPVINTASPSEDENFKLQNILEPQREKFWKCGSTAPGSTNVDIDLGVQTSFRTAGILRNRVHGAGTGITLVQVYTATGTTYPPGAWTNRGTIVVDPTKNNAMLDFGASVTARQIRFTITDAGRYSCKLHVGRATDYLALGNAGANITEGILRARAPAEKAWDQSETYLELAVGIAAVRRLFRFSHAYAASSAKASWLVSMAGFLMLYSDGVWYDCVHVDGEFVTERAVGTTARETHELYAVSLP